MSFVVTRRRALAIVALSLASYAVTGATSSAADLSMTATETVNVRSGPSTASSILGRIARGETVTAVQSKNDWTTVRYRGRTAYVSSRYLTRSTTVVAPVTAAPTTIITTTDVNLRKGPGLSYGVIMVVPDGTSVGATGKASKGYREVVVGTRSGWVSAQYLRAAGSTLPRVIGVRAATAGLNLYTTAANNAAVAGTVAKGTQLAVTGATQNGRAQVVHANAVRWVTAKYLGNLTAAGPVAPGLPKITGTKFATADLLIRSTSADKFVTVDEVPRGTALAVTGAVQNGRAQVIWEGAARWVTAKYLAASPPPPRSGPVTASTGPSSEQGLTATSIRIRRLAIQTFPDLSAIYGVRKGERSDHGTGKALDLMIRDYKSATSRALGFRVAAWARTNARALGIHYVIWDQKIWNITRDREGWRHMASRGSDGANHKNHVHISVW